MFLAGLLLACGSVSEPQAQQPTASDGAIDLSDWDFGRDGPVDLIGEWELYWEQLLDPVTPADAAQTPRDGFLDLPAMWNGSEIDGEQLGLDGYATFRLRVILPEAPAPMGFRLHTMGTAFALFANGEPVTSAGVVGTTRETSEPDWRPHVAPFHTNADSLDLIMHVSNFHHRKGGPVEVVELGHFDDLRRHRERAVAFQMFLAGAFLLIGLYHLSLVVIRRRDRAPFYFSVFCLLIGSYTLLSGERYFATLFPDVSWASRVLLTNATSFLALPIFVTFINALYPREFHRVSLRVVQWGMGVLTLGVFVAPTWIYTRTIPAFHVLVLFGSTVTVVALVRAVIRGREGAPVVLGGFAFFLITIVNDVLYDNLIVQTGQCVYVGLFVFIFTQSVLLAMRFSSAFETIERQGSELALANAANLQEIAERKQAQSALETSEARYRSLVDNVTDIIYTARRNGEITTINENGAELLGYEPAELVGTTIRDLVHPDDVEKVQSTYLEAEVSHTQVQRHFTVRVQARDGRAIWVAVNSHRIFGDDGKTIQEHGVARDITEQKALEAQLQQAQKMEAIGTLAGGIAHDFRNQLTVIGGYTEILLDHPDMTPDQVEQLEYIHRAAAHSTSLTNQLLSFSRKQLLQPRLVDLDNIVADALQPLNRVIPEDIKVITDSSAGRKWVFVDPTQVEQVIMNMAVNASDAMPDGGKITFGTDTVDVGPGESGAREPGLYVVLSVSDTGVGMTEDTCERVFEPFFTTKEAGKGTGLGLSMVYGFVQQSGGWLTVDSNVGKGTKFRIFLPLAEPPDEVTGPGKPQRPVEIGAARVLVVEDDANVRGFLVEALRSFNCTIFVPESVEEALEMAKESINTIDLLISDVVMPNMSGPVLAEKIKRLRPGIKVLFVSGYTESALIERGVVKPGIHLLAKPFSTDVLKDKIRQVLAD